MRILKFSTFWKRLAVSLGLALVVFLLLNNSYVWQNVRFYFQKPAPTQQGPASTQVQAEADHLWIDSLGISVPLKYVDEVSENVFQEALRDGVVHYPGTALPGQVGNAYYFGHSSDYLWSKGRYKTVFALLPRIESGAEIKITDHAGQLFTYTVVETKVVAPDDLSVLNQGDGQNKSLSIQTSYPVGTALRRSVAVAELKQ